MVLATVILEQLLKTADVPVRPRPREKKEEDHSSRNALLALLGGGAAYGAGVKMIDPASTAKLRGFLAAGDQWRSGDVDPRTMIQQYSEQGHQAMTATPFGQSVVDTMQGIRSLPGMPDSFRWKDGAGGSGHHYQQFQRGSVNAYLQRLTEYDKEFNFAPKSGGLPFLADQVNRHGYDGAVPAIERYLADGKSDYIFPGVWKNSPELKAKWFEQTRKFLAEMKPIGRGPDARADGAGAVHRVNGNPAGLSDQMRGAADEFFKVHGVAGGYNAASAELQSKLLPKLDSWVKNRRPELWRNKQFADFEMGSSTVPDAGKWYGLPIRGAFGLQNVLKGAGIGLGVGALGYLGYKGYKALTAPKKPLDDDAPAETPVTPQPVLA